MATCDKESPRAQRIPEWGMGLGSFGDNEAHGKVLLCQSPQGQVDANQLQTVRHLFTAMEIVLIDDICVAR
jgi:hypothetical protein